MSIETINLPDTDTNRDLLENLAITLYAEVLKVKGVQDIYKKLVDYHEKTARHCRGVALIASELALGLALNNQQQKLIVASALLHDIGKLSIKKGLIDLDGIYNDAQRQEMAVHTVEGANKIDESELDFSPTEKEIICSIVKLHHSPKDAVELYLKPLALDEKSKYLIRLGLVIVRLADIAESMTGDTHTYIDRKNLTNSEIVEEIEQDAENFPDVAEKSELLQKLQHIIENLRPKQNQKTNVLIESIE